MTIDMRDGCLAEDLAPKTNTQLPTAPEPQPRVPSVSLAEQHIHSLTLPFQQQVSAHQPTATHRYRILQSRERLTGAGFISLYIPL